MWRNYSKKNQQNPTQKRFATLNHIEQNTLCEDIKIKINLK